MAWENYGLAYVIDQRAGARRRREHRRLGPRVVVADARRPAGREHSRQHRHRFSGRLRAGRVRAENAGAGARLNFANGNNAVPSYVTGCVGGAVRRHGHRRQPARADRTTFDRRSSPDRCARRRGCRTRSRTNRSWTRSRRAVKADPVAYRLRHLSDPPPDRSRARRRRRRRSGRRGRRRVPAIRQQRRRQRPRHLVRAVRRRQRLLRDGRRGRRQPGHGPGRRQATGHRERLRARSRTRTG